MKYNLDKHHRRSIRLKDYDYSQAGVYFITICTQNRECLLGEIIDRDVKLSSIGKRTYECWVEIPKHFENAKLDEFIVMPNHIHGIIIITEQCRGVKFNAPTKSDNYYSQISPKPKTLPVIIRTYKTVITNWCNKNGYAHFKWQRNYYEHIIRDEDDLNQIREYIINNPIKWELDSNHPKNIKQKELKYYAK